MPEENESEEKRNPLHRLHGVYATSYLGYIYLNPPASNAAGVPQIGAYQPKPAPGTGFDQVSGYRLHTMVAWIDFDGSGNLTASGYINRGGIALLKHDFTGTYTIDSTAMTPPPAFTGTFDLNDPGNQVQYRWAMSDNWRRLEFTAIGANTHPLVAAGTLTRV